ncbi:MAG: long-chain fatty acid--CoA ligase [Acidobacteria bacterium]|nr:long-chain fatty acid--CoA ligase [Acidobacteriota bacterium]
MTTPTIPALLHTKAQANPNKTFLYFEDLTISYQELDLITNQVANGLEKLGLKPGDKICILLPNSPEYVYLFLGAPKLGVTVVPINTALKQEECAYIIDNSDACAIVISPNYQGLIKNIKLQSDKLRFIIVIGEQVLSDGLLKEGWSSFSDLLKSSSDLIDYSLPESILSIVYTSGTTGKPKGVMLTQSNYFYDSEQVASTFGMLEEERAMCILPLFHVNGQVVTILTPLQVGASLVLTTGFSPKTFFADLARYQATTFSGVPTIYSILLNLPDREKYNLSNLRLCICGAAPMPVELFHQFEKAFNTVIIEGYGLSEGTCASTANPVNGERKIGSIGLALLGQEIKIFDDQDQEVSSGEVGEIVIRGSNVMLGYYKNEVATSETLRNGWLHTGDLGHVDNDGYFYIVGRKKEMIIRGGENIYPKEVEEILYLHPSVQEAAVIGIPDSIWGEEVGAAIILKGGMVANKDDIISFCKKHLADYKCPRRVFFCSSFPKTATGKVQKNKLVEELLS